MKTLIVSLSLLCAIAAADAAAAPAKPVSAPPMVTVPTGQFTMGSTEPRIGDGSHNPAEQPPHLVRIQSFRLARYETTVGQFRQFVAATGYRTQDACWQFDRADGMARKDVKWDTPAHAPGEFHPVLCVTWDDANAYAAWLSDQTGRRFRLPSEAEWEYAARAGTTTRYPSGDDADGLCTYANMKDRRFKAALKQDYGLDMLATDCDDGAAFTTVVGMYPANAFGLYDMIGNVAEWVADCEHPDYQGAPADGTVWRGACEKENEYFITRGGSYASARAVLRSAARGHGGRTNASSLGEGFRIAEDIGACDEKCAANDADFDAALALAQKTERDRRLK
jgi:formylglycine-generating enzyme required for sulfatase activity